MSLALLFHYLLLNVFRMLKHPSSGACDLFDELFHGLYCSGSMCVGVTLPHHLSQCRNALLRYTHYTLTDTPTCPDSYAFTPAILCGVRGGGFLWAQKHSLETIIWEQIFYMDKGARQLTEKPSKEDHHNSVLHKMPWGWENQATRPTRYA